MTLTSREFDPADDERVVALYARLEAHDASINALDLAGWRAFRAMPAFADGRHFRVVEKARELVALMTLGRLGDVIRMRIFVDPSARRVGIATAMLREGEVHARASGALALESFVEGAWAAGRAFAAGSGFAPFIHDLFLTRPATPFDAPVPDGVRIRPYVPGPDNATWAALANATLVRDAGFHAETAQSVVGYTRAPGFAFIFAETDAPVGFCHVERRETVGYIQGIGVLAGSGSRGIGAALLSRAIEMLAGVPRIELCTEEDNVRAQRLYARAGFTLARDAFTLRKNM